MSFKDEFKSADTGIDDFEILPDGEYSAIIDNSSLDIQKEPARLSVTYKITEGKFQNRRVFTNYNLAGKGLGFLKKDMKTLGIDYSMVEKPEDVARLMFANIGQGVGIFVNSREYNGKKYNNAFLNSAEKAKSEVPF